MANPRTIREIVEDAIRAGATDSEALDRVRAEKPAAKTTPGHIGTIRRRMRAAASARASERQRIAPNDRDADEAQLSPNGADIDHANRYDDYAENEQDNIPVSEYDISATPTDFNVMTLYSLTTQGGIRIPGFQRHFVWDIRKASKLIESLILGLPVPQLFLYDNNAGGLVIDGQQRLMSIYYFIRGRFPRPTRRADLRRIFDENGGIPDNVVRDNEYFRDFNLQLPEALPDHRNRLRGLSYDRLGEKDKHRLNMRPVRCIYVRQNSPANDDSSMYEIFNRLNSGGMNLRPQELRSSMYNSKFYDMLNRVNGMDGWRRLAGEDADPRMKDVETLLRGFAMLVYGKKYRPSMVRFLNAFSKQCMDFDDMDNDGFESLFGSFVESAADLPPRVFINPRTNRFNIALYEAVFTATCDEPYRQGGLVSSPISAAKIEELRADREFLSASQKATTSTENVQLRLRRAASILLAN